MLKDIVVIGCGGQSRVIVDLIEQLPSCRLIGLLDDDPNRPAMFQGYPVLGDTSSIAQLSHSIDGVVIGVGDNWIRRKIAEKIKAVNKEISFISLVHPSAYVSPRCKIGAGTVVLAGAIINTNVALGEHCIVNTLASVGHDSKIGNFSSVGPGAHLGGTVIVGENSTIALGARILHNMTIGDHTVIGSGATVTKDFGNYVVSYGSPAKFIRKRNQDERYL